MLVYSSLGLTLERTRYIILAVECYYLAVFITHSWHSSDAGDLIDDNPANAAPALALLRECLHYLNGMLLRIWSEIIRKLN